MCGLVSCEEYGQDRTTRGETQNIENINAKETGTTTSILKQEGRKYVVLLTNHEWKEDCITTPKNQDWKKVEMEKANKFLQLIITETITQLKGLLYSGAGLVSRGKPNRIRNLYGK